MNDRNELAEQVADSLVAGVWLVARDGQILYRNAACEHLAPGARALPELARLLPGVPVAAYVHQVGTDRSAVAEPAVLLRRGASSSIVQLHIIPGPAGIEGSVVITLEEVTARLRVERLRALAETTVAVCHEINNPLAILSGEIELLHRDGNAPAERMATLHAAVARIADVLRQLKHAAEPLSAGYLPSRGVSMLDLKVAPQRAGAARAEGSPAGDDPDRRPVDDTSMRAA